jgi:Arc/MetJ-type ribon-helix-helix transcriptional regulator
MKRLFGILSLDSDSAGALVQGDFAPAMRSCTLVSRKENRFMNLEIHKPKLVQRVQAQIRSGNFHDTDELIEKALDALDEKAAVAPRPPTAPKNLVELFAPLRGQFTDEEVDTLFGRNR